MSSCLGDVVPACLALISDSVAYSAIDSAIDAFAAVLPLASSAIVQLAWSSDLRSCDAALLVAALIP